MMTKSKWTAALLLVATFVLGVLSGGAAVATADRGTAASRHPSGGMVEHLADQLGLDARQQDSIRTILEAHHEAFQSVSDQISADILAVLTDDQVERYEAMKSDMRLHGRPHRRGEPQTSNPDTPNP